MVKQNFSLKHYEELINGFRAKGYDIVNFTDVEASERHLVLRHDVDFDIEAAAEMAEFEMEKGIHATYFVLVRTEFYNVFSKKAKIALERIKSSGHKIGLHFDAELYSGDTVELIRAANDECHLLGLAIENKISLLSFHRPHPNLLETEIEFDGILSAYSRRFFEDIGYCSDSQGSWRYGHPLDHSTVIAGHALQLLTHPIWWVGHKDSDAQDTIAHFLSKRQDELEQQARAHCAAYRPAVQNKV